MSPRDLLDTMKLIELKLGRKKRQKWAQREIDIDIIAYQGAVTRTSDLWIPHKEIVNRLFILKGLMDLDPDYVLEGMDENVEQLYKRISPQLQKQVVTTVTWTER